MSLWPLYTILAAATIITLTAITAIAVGHQTEERPGTIDLTGIKPRQGYDWNAHLEREVERLSIQAHQDHAAFRRSMSGSRVRAEVGALEDAFLNGHEVYMSESGAIVTAPPGALAGVPAGFSKLSDAEVLAFVDYRELTELDPLKRGTGGEAA